MKPLGETLGLWFRRDFETNAKACAARDALLRIVLSIESGPGLGIWKPFAFFDAHGTCVATLDAALLTMVIDGEPRTIGAIRSVATHPDWRGRGLFRALLSKALTWLDAADAGFVLLYSAEPAIYTRFGFRDVVQHAFVGPRPAHVRFKPERAFALNLATDHRMITDMVASRAPVSRCALQIDPDQFLCNLAGDPDLRIAHLVDEDALVIFEDGDQALVIVDVAARVIPSIATIVGALNFSSRPIRTLFEPDRLGWHGDPVPESTGLMARGVLPNALLRPFMLPPTAEF